MTIAWIPPDGNRSEQPRGAPSGRRRKSASNGGHACGRSSCRRRATSRHGSSASSVHFAVLVIMASITLLLPIQQRVLLSAFPLPEFEEEPLTAQEFHFSPDPHEQVGALGAERLGHGPADRAGREAEHRRSRTSWTPTTIGEIEVHEFDRTILEGPNIPENVIVKGAGSVGTSGAIGAVDRITHEILLSLDERPTLVVWLFDQSGSLKPQRESIAKRFDRVYEELGIIEKSRQRGVQAARREAAADRRRASLARACELLTPKPTDDLTEIKAAVRAVSDDTKARPGKRFQSVGFLAEKFRH